GDRRNAEGSRAGRPAKGSQSHRFKHGTSSSTSNSPLATVLPPRNALSSFTRDGHSCFSITGHHFTRPYTLVSINRPSFWTCFFKYPSCSKPHFSSTRAEAALKEKP